MVYVQACLGVTRNQQLGVRYCGSTHLRFRGFIWVKCSFTWQALAWIGTNSICKCRFAWMKLGRQLSRVAIFNFWHLLFVLRANFYQEKMKKRAASLVKLLISGARWCIKAKYANTLECGHHRLRAVTVYPGFLESIPIRHDLPILITV